MNVVFETERPTRGRALLKLIGLNALVVFCQIYAVWMLLMLGHLIDDRIPDLPFGAVVLVVAAYKVVVQEVRVRWRE
jgi:hypothetical protein